MFGFLLNAGLLRLARALVFLFGSGFLVGQGALAHVADTSLLRIHVLADVLVVDWNADLLTLRRLADLDLDGDGKVQRRELAQAGARLDEVVRELFRLKVNGEAVDLGKATPPEWQGAEEEADVARLQEVHVNLHFERAWKEGRKPFGISADVFQKLGDKHRVIAAVIQGGDSQQTVLTSEFTGLLYDPEAVSQNRPQVSGFEMVKLGVEHILTGTDHLLFLVTLLVVVGTWRQLLGIVTAFTVAHSVTLALAVFEVVRLPEKLVESTIALSIAWVAMENLVRGAGTKRWLLTFGFGLIHGFGFAGALRELELPKQGLLKSLLLFNVGVESGQLLVVLPLLPLILWVRRFEWSVVFQRMVSGVALVAALWWLVERLLA